ncbi:MAG: hypothetical protein AB1798_04905 [Spirochaetota bacterium]
MDPVLKQLAECGQPWVEYNTRINLLKETGNKAEVKSIHNSLVHHSSVVSLTEELKQWPGTVLNSHKSAHQCYHKLAFLADIGIQQDDPGMAEIIQQIKKHVSEEGLYQLPMNIPQHYGGSGTDVWAWALCDAPTILYALVKFGLKNELNLEKPISFLASVCQSNGWPCTVSKELGSFHGPGKKSDPCPYATLLMLKLLALDEKWSQSREAENGIESLLTLWADSREKHPYMFYMGTDFRKLKVPLIWYDIVHAAYVLSQYPTCRQDKRFQKMVSVIVNKTDSNGLFVPESEWKAWKEWDFGQKKKPSMWLTYIIKCIMVYR